MYINSDNLDSFFYIEKFDIIDKPKHQIYENNIELKLTSIPNFLKLQNMFIKLTYIQVFFFKYLLKLSLLNLHFKFKFKIKRKIKKNRRKKIIIKLFSTSFFLKQNLQRPFRYRKHKTKKMSPRQPYSYVLKSRKFFRRILSIFKLKSYKLTKILLRFFKKKTSNINNLLHNTLGNILLKSGFILNLMDSYFFLKTGSIFVNNKPTTEFFLVLKAGDLVTLFNPVFFSNYFIYFKYNKMRWLKRKKRRNTYKLRRFINFNKNILTINLIIRRWLSNFSFFISRKSNFEIDFKTYSILVFQSKLARIRHFFNPLIKPLGIFNIWYYNF